MAKKNDLSEGRRIQILDQVRWVQSVRRDLDNLYRNAGTQSLTWDVILLIAEAQYAGQDINVSDVCVSVSASKSSVLKLIAQLVVDKVVTKHRKERDTRTHLLRLHDGFQRKFESHLEEMVLASPKP